MLTAGLLDGVELGAEMWVPGLELSLSGVAANAFMF